MIIVHEINEFLFDLFPRAKDFGNSIDILKEEITEYYTFSIYQPQVEIKDNFVFITFDVDKVSHEEKEYQKAISFCDKGKFTLAKPILEKLVKNNPTVSEYHRILGQIYSLEGDQETAINFLIDALKWNPKNGNAFILTGNIFARFKHDVKTALKYYNKALEINTDDYIAINNIGGNLLNLNQFGEAQKYFLLASEINPKYPNPYAGLAQVYFFRAEFLTAINYGIQALKNSTYNDPIYKHITKLVYDSSVDYMKMNQGMKIFDRYNEELVKKCGKPIELVFDDMIEGYAKIEVAEYYSRETHFLKYKKERKGLEHLFMHELVHLDFILEAREADNNHIFYSTTKNKELFIGDIESILKKYEAIGLSKDEIENLTNRIFNGMNNQFFNTPIDLYIEDYLFHNFPELRPIQYLSLLEMYTENIESINNQDINKHFPFIVSETSTVLNLALFLQFRDLFGYDLMPSLKITYAQKRQSKELYDSWLMKRDAREQGSEYEFIKKWGKLLKLDKYFELVPENKYRQSENLSGLLNDITEDPYNLNDPDAIAYEGKRLDMGDSPAGGMAVAMYCVDALETFNGKSKDYIQEVGFEIATLGRFGLDPGNIEKSYHLKAIPDKTFTALHLLAFMYVAFQHIDPNLDTGLDFKSQYEMAKVLFNKK